jgi:hypothetical protein
VSIPENRSWPPNAHRHETCSVFVPRLPVYTHITSLTKLMVPCVWFAVGYVPYFGKKVDPEPGRCRRTDGKKWRCSKEAAPDSKYCERHMHRGRNRSRKPVEAQLVAAPLSQPPAPANLAGGFQNHTLYPTIAGGGAGRGGGATGTFGLGSTAQLHMDNAAPYATAAGGGSKDLR